MTMEGLNETCVRVQKECSKDIMDLLVEIHLLPRGSSVYKDRYRKIRQLVDAYMFFTPQLNK